MSDKKIAISVRMPVGLHEKVHQIASEMSLEGDSQLYRWIIEGFIDAVESETETPPISPVLEIARKVHHAKRKNGNGHKKAAF